MSLTCGLVLSACVDDATSPVAPRPPSTASVAVDATGWTTVPSPNRGSLANSLADLTIVSANDIWAVGEWNPGVPPTATGRRTLVEHWNGASWQLVPSPNASWTGVDLSTLEAVAAVAGNSIWAVGHANDFASLRSTTLIVHWDGTQWSVVPSPNPAGANQPNELHDLVVLSANDIWAVGYQGYPERALILHWNGTSWRNVANNCGEALYAVTAVSASNLWAVGDGTTCRFNGQTWNEVPPAEFATFTSVAAVAASEVWAVGKEYYCYYACSSVSHIERWNGTRWIEVSHPTSSTWNDIVAIAPNDVWTVGDNATWGLALHWNGAVWSQAAIPNAGNGSSLNAVAAVGAARLWAVGRYYTPHGIPRTWTVMR